jgi:pyruvyltransferase
VRGSEFLPAIAREPLAQMRRWRERRCVFWWEPRDGVPNAGDELARVLVAEILRQAGRIILDKRDKRCQLFTIGSVLHYARSGDCVWGSGVNGKIPAAAHRFRHLDVRAVRGPLTRDFLLARGIACPPVFGDPALLAPMFFPADSLCQERGALDFVVVPHLNDPPGLWRAFGDRMCSPRQQPLAFLRQLLRARRVVSASLHGLVLAEAYGLPAVRVDLGGSEPPFKYEDYYQGTGRAAHSLALSVDQALEMDPQSPPANLPTVARRLLEAFPYDLWGIPGTATERNTLEH